MAREKQKVKRTFKQTEEEVDFLSTQVSNIIRQATFGLIAVLIGFLLGDPEININLLSLSGVLMFLLALSVLIILLFDFLQYFLGYLHVARIHGEIDKSGLDSISYDKDNLGYKARAFFFYAKSILLVVAILLFLFFLFSYVFSRSG